MGRIPAHNERLSGVGHTTRAVTDRIVRVWHAATPGNAEAGAQWYPAAGAFADALAAESGLSRPHVAAVVAHLSPRTTWERNMRGAASLLASGRAPGCLEANVERALVAIGSADPLGTINGPKTGAFAANILGDYERVTVDVWAARIALGVRDDAERVLSRVGVYPALEYAYRLAAARVGVSPATMQATTWVVARNGRAD